ncbi:Uncharacterised protein [Haploplasma axanthum]|uniref:Uncharacterized protein n=1 Tax=Haploplasma axanthum TaxID=29552 RepID=A0A449BFQ7_HAPAX|nr:Uncharacterised protein [Haploplasma axanthum]
MTTKRYILFIVPLVILNINLLIVRKIENNVIAIICNIVSIVVAIIFMIWFYKKNNEEK